MSLLLTVSLSQRQWKLYQHFGSWGEATAVLSANFCGPSRNIHSKVNWSQKLSKLLLGSSTSITEIDYDVTGVLLPWACYFVCKESNFTIAEFKGEDVPIAIESTTLQFFGPSHNISSKMNWKEKLLKCITSSEEITHPVNNISGASIKFLEL